jgi:hypothetical protein
MTAHGGMVAGQGAVGAGDAIGNIINAITAGGGGKGNRPPTVGRFPTGSKNGWVNTGSLIPIHSADSLIRDPATGKIINRVDFLANSIQKNGFNLNNAVEIQRVSDGRNIIMQGHHRAAALQQLGYTEVPVIYNDDVWTPEMADAFLSHIP